jgi:hypothetical protein
VEKVDIANIITIVLLAGLVMLMALYVVGMFKTSRLAADDLESNKKLMESNNHLIEAINRLAGIIDKK